MVTIFGQGDIVYLDFDPQSGHEQKGRRPALVISNNLFNRVSSLTMVCPITHTDRGHLLCGACSGGYLLRGGRYGHRISGAEVAEETTEDYQFNGSPPSYL